jgi:cysteine desulfurase
VDIIYMDHAATTPVYPDVVDTMVPYFQYTYGNPSSVHQFGREGKTALDSARGTIAQSLSCEPNEIIFTSGGTEADNFALFGSALANKVKGNHIITSSIEHHAVLHTCEKLEKMGFEVTYLPVDETGRVRLQDVRDAIRDETILISIMYGNNEVGTIQPIGEITAIAKEKGILVHTDAVQAYGIIPLNPNQLAVDMLSVSAHKINGPKGVGALYLSRSTRIEPHLFGGSQEKKRRAGTENVPGIMGFAKAAELTQAAMEQKRAVFLEIRHTLLNTLEENQMSFFINGHPTEFLPHILNLSFPGIDSEVMLMNLDLAGVAASSGSACTAGSLSVSHVLQAMRLDEARLKSAIRFSFGINNTVEQAAQVGCQIAQIVKRLSRS